MALGDVLFFCIQSIEGKGLVVDEGGQDGWENAVLGLAVAWFFIGGAVLYFSGLADSWQTQPWQWVLINAAIWTPLGAAGLLAQRSASATAPLTDALLLLGYALIAYPIFALMSVGYVLIRRVYASLGLDWLLWWT